MPEKCKKCGKYWVDESCVICTVTATLIEDKVPEECPEPDDGDSDGKYM